MFRLYDTRTRQVEEIRPASRGLLRIYACGPTVYRYAHLGNMRTYLLSDLIRRVAQRHGVTVHQSARTSPTSATSPTTAEIDPGGEDKILAQARAEGRTALEIARSYEDAFAADCLALNITGRLLAARIGIHRADDRHDREADRDRARVRRRRRQGVLRCAQSFPGYGELSGNRLDQLRPGHRSGGATDPRKRFHADWALWKGAPEGRELTWAAPWGTGFPGWHTECSAMSLHFLGEVIDIHTGGIDLRFPHHEDERAQSDSVTGHEVVRHWVHGEHLLFEGRKMAKSTGNVVLVADLAAQRPRPARGAAGLPRAPLPAAAEPHLGDADRGRRHPTAVAGADRGLGRIAQQADVRGGHRPDRGGLGDDLDTRAAVAALRRLEKDPEIPPGSKFETFVHADRYSASIWPRDIGRAAAPAPLPGGAAQKLAERREARAASDWATADRLRDELAAIGVIVSDTPDGQAWTAGRGQSWAASAAGAQAPLTPGLLADRCSPAAALIALLNNSPAGPPIAQQIATDVHE